ncbi:uncharacterized protein LOC127652376 [Xyrauchen texanus]|uniref:uncharacterized protein LOC127652376 n=1 Tax=Xyrauchen texanus TaxID=154827 RepID=UPI0022420FED|nr:uncharacterized protein LOC127652376 [Xyrauchen texanus]
MEREGFLRSLQFLESAGLRVGAVVTDRHPSIQKYLREQRPDIQHYFDTWHVSKGLAKKIDALGKERSCGEVLAWRRSIINHLYWCASSSKTGTKACERFCDLMINQRLLKDVSKLSPHHQTSTVEGFHSLILKFAPKNVAFSFLGMLNRLHLAALHYNENSNREYACNRSGEPSIKVKWPKYKKGDHSLHYTKTEPTYNYVESLLRLFFEEVVINPGPYQEQINELKVPDHLCAAFDKPNLQESEVRPWSRFTQME